eukprot:6218125-Alexandrium_andersonii.AAC.1
MGLPKVSQPGGHLLPGRAFGSACQRMGAVGGLCRLSAVPRRVRASAHCRWLVLCQVTQCDHVRIRVRACSSAGSVEIVWRRIECLLARARACSGACSVSRVESVAHAGVCFLLFAMAPRASQPQPSEGNAAGLDAFFAP